MYGGPYGPQLGAMYGGDTTCPRRPQLGFVLGGFRQLVGLSVGTPVPVAD